MYLYGASGHAKVIIDILKAVGESINGLIDDNPEVEQLQGYAVEHGYSGQTPLIISIGSNFVRKKIAERIGANYGTAIHPSAIVSPTATIGEGTVVMQGAVIQAEAKIGKHCIINTGASVDHECRIEDYVHVSPHATLCGNVSVGEGTWVGAGSTIVQGIKIGKWSVIGAGTVVARNVPDGVLVVGNRMQRIRDITPEMLNKLNQGGVNYLEQPISFANEAIEKHLQPNKEGRKKVNILICSAGKRVKLVKLFKNELKKHFLFGRVYTTDMNPTMSPAGIVSDGCFKVSRVTSPSYINELISICKENEIALVIPTIDTELLVLARNKFLLEESGIIPVISNETFVAQCRDKRKTADLFKRLGIRVPAARDKHHPVFPMFAKPYDGSLSKDLHVIKDESELSADVLNNPKLVFMEYIDKNEYKEFTVDMYFGRDNMLKSAVPRERIEIRAGEINKGITRKNYLLEYLEERMGYIPGVEGCICVQLFYREADNDVVGIEINPRFGGGYPLSFYAGANYPSYIIKEYLKGEDIAYSKSWSDNTLMLRYDDEVILYDCK